MTTFTGSVYNIDIYEDHAWVKINTAHATASLMLWSDYDVDYTPSQRIIHGMWLTLCRDSLSNGLSITVTTAADDSSLATNVSLWSD
jgi:hypothetical protein